MQNRFIYIINNIFFFVKKTCIINKIIFYNPQINRLSKLIDEALQKLHTLIILFRQEKI